VRAFVVGVVLHQHGCRPCVCLGVSLTPSVNASLTLIRSSIHPSIHPSIATQRQQPPGHIPLDLREAPLEDLYGIFTENAIVLVGGEVGDAGAFKVMQMGWPPPEPRCVSFARLCVSIYLSMYVCVRACGAGNSAAPMYVCMHGRRNAVLQASGF